MDRTFSSKSDGRSFTSYEILAVWQKAHILPGYDASEYRKDRYGNTIEYSQYGNLVSYGWEIDHIKPIAKGGIDELSNLQPLQWQENRKKSDTYPY